LLKNTLQWRGKS